MNFEIQIKSSHVKALQKECIAQENNNISLTECVRSARSVENKRDKRFVSDRRKIETLGRFSFK